MTTRLAVGADDYGLAPGVDAAIRDLIERGVVTATSCMTVFPEWRASAAALRPLADRADLGVHLVLTDQAPLGPTPSLAPHGRLPPFGTLLRLAHARRLDLDAVHAELSRQIDAFEDALGQRPDHLDGHQHVQQLPGVRDVVLDLARRLAPGGWVRTCAERPAAILRRPAAVRALAFAAAGRGLRRRLAAAGVPTPAGLTGVYGFDVPYDDVLPAFLHDVVDGSVLLVHPGFPDDVLRGRDGLVGPRAGEHAALRDRLPALAAERGLRLVRLRARAEATGPSAR